MGLLDSLGGALLKGVLGQMGEGAIPAVLGQILGGNGQGGLSAIIEKLQNAGMDEQVKSWLGNGENLPISADQLKSVLDNEQVKQMAESFGIPLDNVLDALAQHLPGVVDKASPNGELETST